MTATALPQDAHSDAVTCKWCGKSFHHLKSHISMGRCEGIPEEAKGLGVDDVVKMYTTAFPGEPTLSPKAIEALKNKRSEKAGADGKIADISSHPGYAGTVEYKTELVAAHELLGLTIKELGTPRGKPLQVTVNINTPYPEFVPEVKAGYIYGDFDLIKDIFMMLEIGIPGYLWGHAGTGKTSLPTQLCALLNRPVIRSQ
ncbi:porphyrin biosynthesis protein, partial [Klebsiella pneumoniae]